MEDMMQQSSNAGRKVVVQEPEWETVGTGGQLNFEDEAPLEPFPDDEEDGDDEIAREAEVPKLQTGNLPLAQDGPPAWAKIPKKLKFPRGRQAIFLRFKPEWTDTPGKGERQCILWPLTDPDERVAQNRAMQDPNRVLGQMAKQMVRAVDGHVADWTSSGGAGDMDAWWNEIGAKCRHLIVKIYLQSTALGAAEQKDFFENCIAVVSAG